MAFHHAPFSLANWHNEFECILNAWKREARPDVKQVKVWTDFAYDEIDLGVTFRLFTGTELRDGSPRELREKFARRVIDLLQIKRKTPKQISVERRRMHWRGECARKAKAKRK